MTPRTHPSHRSLATALLATLLCLPAFAGTVEQRQAQTEIDTVGTALFAWLTDQVAIHGGAAGTAAAGGGGLCSQVSVDVSVLPVLSHGMIEALLVPTYLTSVPENDPWGFPYEYRVSDVLLSSPFAAVRATGSDGTFSGSTYGYGEISAPTDDLVWLDGSRIRAFPLEPYRRQITTVQDIRAVGTAMFSWLTDQVAITEGPFPAGAAVDLTDFTPITASALAALLTPNYMSCVPENDRWGHPFEYWLAIGDLLGTEVAAIRSTGRDGTSSGQIYTPGNFPSSERDQDLVWADGLFVRSPAADGLFFEDGFEGGDICAWSQWTP